MKTFFLGLDGLDHNLCHKWNCHELLQKEHGDIVVPINEKQGVPLSPEVWAAFLMGKEAPKLEFEVERPMGNIVMKALKFGRKLLPLKLGLGQKWNIMRFPELKEHTFIDDGCLAINVPFYNYDHQVQKLDYEYLKGKTGLSWEEYMKLLEDIFDEKQRLVFHMFNHAFLNGFAYLEFPDAIEHRAYMREDYLEVHYKSLCDFVRQIRFVLNFERLIIVSDHGFDLAKGNHSCLGFFSSNKLLEPQPKEITDFYRLVEK